MNYTKESRTYAMLNRGEYDILQPDQYPFIRKVLLKIQQSIFSGIEEIMGSRVCTQAQQLGLTKLHHYFSVEKIGALRDFVMPIVRPNLLQMACQIAHDHLGIGGNFYVDDYTILRINYPYEVARFAPYQAENPGIGRTSQFSKEHFNRHKRIDPVYNPRQYHKNLPPPAWAHGAHLDTWAGHSRNGINIWWAIVEALPENSMVFYPDYWGKSPAPDPTNLYIKAGYPLLNPVKMPLREGEMLVFNPELLHGTHLNITDSTRIAISVRINPQKPTFSRKCFYAREYWQSADNIESGIFDKIFHFPRENNFMPEEEEINTIDPPISHNTLLIDQEFNLNQENIIGSSQLLKVDEKLLVKFKDKMIIVLRTQTGQLHAFDALCPHLSINLMDGNHDNEGIYCPSDGVKFSFKDGRSMAESLTLSCYKLEEQGEQLILSKN